VLLVQVLGFVQSEARWSSVDGMCSTCFPSSLHG
jgi:hypothetical protein